MVLTAGQTLQRGQYTIVKQLGQGRFGLTYLAERPNGDRWVIKVLNSFLSDSLTEQEQQERDRLETMFWQEAVKLQQCSGTPHIVQAKKPFKEAEMICLPLEYVDGNSLGDRPQRKLLEKTALNYIQQIGIALTKVHAQNLVHRDIRPENILLRLQDGRVKAVLTDFGLAVDVDTELSRSRRRERTDGYSPIELYGSGRKVGPYTDVYSLAATLYELLTGKVPESAIDRLQGDSLTPPQDHNPEISGKTTKAILKGMKLLPQERPQSVEQWLSLLDLDPLPRREPNWAKWQAVWTANSVLTALLTALVTLWAGIPSWLNLKKPEPMSLPQPTSSQSPSLPQPTSPQSPP